MGDRSSIEWTEATWNPVTGCSKVSPGCAHCYAETWAKRGLGNFAGGRPFEDVRCHEDRLDVPLRWRRPRRIFVNSMSDLFHEDVPDAFIDRVFAVMALAPQHTFQVLTKRVQRMRDYLAGWGKTDMAYRLNSCVNFIAEVQNPRDLGWMRRRNSAAAARGLVNAGPLPNVWLGVSVENQRFADERIPLLLQTPAAVRFISAEPLLGPVEFDGHWLTHRCNGVPMSRYDNAANTCRVCFEKRDSQAHGLDWVIVGGESGPDARPFDLAWARSIIAQCRAAGVPCFVKQLGAQPRTDAVPGHEGQQFMPVYRSRKGGDPEEWPADLRVREYPV